MSSLPWNCSLLGENKKAAETFHRFPKHKIKNPASGKSQWLQNKTSLKRQSHKSAHNLTSASIGLPSYKVSVDKSRIEAVRLYIPKNNKDKSLGQQDKTVAGVSAQGIQRNGSQPYIKFRAPTGLKFLNVSKENSAKDNQNNYRSQSPVYSPKTSKINSPANFLSPQLQIKSTNILKQPVKPSFLLNKDRIHKQKEEAAAALMKRPSSQINPPNHNFTNPPSSFKQMVQRKATLEDMLNDSLQVSICESENDQEASRVIATHREMQNENGWLPLSLTTDTTSSSSDLQGPK